MIEGHIAVHIIEEHARTLGHGGADGNARYRTRGTHNRRTHCGPHDRRTYRIIEGRVRTGSHGGADGNVDGAAGSEQGRRAAVKYGEVKLKCGVLKS